MYKNEIDPWFLENLVCPVSHESLEYLNGDLVSVSGRRYPVVEGIPVMLVDKVEQTIGVASESIMRAADEDYADDRAKRFHLESLGISEEEKEVLIKLIDEDTLSIDPVVALLIGATSGYAYQHLIGKLDSYPIPAIRLPKVEGDTLLDIGCNWGRWSLSAARRGYQVIGIDPSLGAVLAARRVGDQLSLSNRYLVADSRFLPFKKNSYQTVFSYSVLQHLSKTNTKKSISEIMRVLKPSGTSLIQMPTIFGVRCLYHQAKRKFRKPSGFEVRYWTLPELRRVFGQIGATSVSVDCYFGIGLQKTDIPLMPYRVKYVILLSEFLRRISDFLPFMKYIADSIYIKSQSSNVPTDNRF